MKQLNQSIVRRESGELTARWRRHNLSKIAVYDLPLASKQEYVRTSVRAARQPSVYVRVHAWVSQQAFLYE